MYDIITFGSATQDVFMSSRKFQKIESEKFNTKKGLCMPLGTKIQMDKVVFSMGGIGANTAVTFARQGLETAYLGQIGKDISAQVVKHELSKQGVSMEFIKEREEWQTAYSVIISLPDVGRSILEKYGACHEIIEQDIPFDKIKTKWFYIGSLSGNSSKIFKSLLKFAGENDIKIAHNPGKTQLSDDINILRDNLDKIDILILNQEEAAKLTDLDIEQEKEIFNKLDELVQGIVVMTKGPDGVVVSDGKKKYSAGIPKSPMIERTGAGDAFGSAFVSGWIEKKDIAYAIQLGTANATSCLQEIGATNGLLKKGEWGGWDKVEVVNL
ncbi:carbohydrate kinase family protein [Patescibacteria group bacterium]